MSSFLTGLTHNDVVGENNMPAHSTSDSAVLDLFFMLGTRPKEADLLPAVARAWGEDPSLTLKALFQARDVRQGKGERQSFRDAIKFLADNSLTYAPECIKLIPEYGRWDDFHILMGTKLEELALDTIAHGLYANDGLCAKWQPRKGELAEKLRKYLGLTPKQYRKKLVELTKVVETQMCAKEWDSINYSHVPSQASRIYSKAFARHDADRYKQWKEDLKKPKEERADKDAKVNVGATYPHEIVSEAEENSDYPFEEAWATMLAAFPSSDEKVLTVCDVSGSMAGLPIQVCVALGLFMSQKNTGPFADCFVTFSAHPQLQKLTGSLRDRINQLDKAEWTMNTNLEAVFRLVARAAQGAKPEDVPGTILIMSDMQFDQAVSLPNSNALQLLDAEFAAVGAQRPKVVFWNLRDAGNKTKPVKAHESGAALLSGFSPNLLKGILNNPKDFTPIGIMLGVLMTQRYEAIHV